jgi:UDP-glucose 6-dehydrogenase
VQPYDSDVWACLKNSDAAVLMVAHEAYRRLDMIKLKSILRTPIVIDGRRLFDPAAARLAGLIYRAVGLART